MLSVSCLSGTQARGLQPLGPGGLKGNPVESDGSIIPKIMYHDGLAHKVEAGADLSLMPSRYEPCGLNQIYSLLNKS